MGNAGHDARRITEQQREQAKPTVNPRQWSPHLSSYADQRVLTFATNKDLERAIDLLWTDALRTLPHETPDGTSLVIPAEALEYFSRAGLQFTQKPVRSLRELSAQEIKELRR